jgi:hypothetical protein
MDDTSVYESAGYGFQFSGVVGTLSSNTEGVVYT